MKDCKKFKLKAIAGFILFICFYSTKYFLKGGSYSGEIEFLLITMVIIIMVITFKLVLPYLKCLSDYNNKHKPPFSK